MASRLAGLSCAPTQRKPAAHNANQTTVSVAHMGMGNQTLDEVTPRTEQLP